MKGTEATIELIEDDGSEEREGVQMGPDGLLYHFIDCDKIEDLEDVIMIFKAISLSIPTNHPMFVEMRHLLIDAGEESE